MRENELLCSEWLLQEALGIKMTGYEVNRSWWEGSHSIPHFINIGKYINMFVLVSQIALRNIFQSMLMNWMRKAASSHLTMPLCSVTSTISSIFTNTSKLTQVKSSQ